MKKLVVALLAVVFLASAGLVVYSQTSEWENPEGPPPQNNVAKPLNQGLGTQVKDGALKILKGIGLGGYDPDDASLLSSPSGFFGAPGAGTHIDDTAFQSDINAQLAKNDSSQLAVGNPSAFSSDAKFVVDQPGAGNVVELRGQSSGNNLGTGQVVDQDFSGGLASGTQVVNETLELEQDPTTFSDNLVWNRDDANNVLDVVVDETGQSLFTLEGINVVKRRASDGSQVWSVRIGNPLWRSLAYDDGKIYLLGELRTRYSQTCSRLTWPHFGRDTTTIVDGVPTWYWSKIDAQTGREEWRTSKQLPVSGCNYYSRTYGIGHLYHPADIEVENGEIFYSGMWGSARAIPQQIHVWRDNDKFHAEQSFFVAKRKIIDGSIIRENSFWPSTSSIIHRSGNPDNRRRHLSNIVLDQNIIYAAGEEGQIFQIQRSDLQRIATSNVGTPNLFNFKSLLYDDTRVFSAAGGNLTSLDKISGAREYALPLSTPLPTIVENGSHVYLAGSNRIEKRSKANGTFVWNQPTLSSVNVLVEDNDFLYIGGSGLEKRGLDASLGRRSSGVFTSRVFDTGQQSDFLFILPASDLPPGTTASYQISTSNNNIDWTPFTGPNGTESDFYISQDTPIHSMHHNKRYARYQVTLQTSNPSRTPTLNAMTISYKQAGVSLGDTQAHVVVTTEGKVGIGTLSPRTILDVGGEISQRGARLHADVAEDYPVVDNAGPGDIVMISAMGNFGVERAQKSESAKIIGIISTSPGYRINAGESDWKPVALVGRVPVKVNLENGPIMPGDAITISSIPGVGMKALREGEKVVGFALDEFSAGAEGEVYVFVNISYYNEKPI